MGGPQVDPEWWMGAPLSPSAMDIDSGINNKDQLPSIFFYLLNICAKALVNQFILEAGVKPESADAIGMSAMTIFTAPTLLWRSRSFIDILICKFRAACPVLFGIRGSEETVKGRIALGWRRTERHSGAFVDSNVHNGIMTGLAAGYASISLRNFSKARRINPYPPPNWWYAFAAVTKTQAGHISNTHFVVLKAMVEHFEQKIFDFYADKGIGQFVITLSMFPHKAQRETPEVKAVMALAQMVRLKQGLELTGQLTPMDCEFDRTPSTPKTWVPPTPRTSRGPRSSIWG